jgi:hypothetical protein
MKTRGPGFAPHPGQPLLKKTLELVLDLYPDHVSVGPGEVDERPHLHGLVPLAGHGRLRGRDLLGPILWISFGQNSGTKLKKRGQCQVCTERFFFIFGDTENWFQICRRSFTAVFVHNYL